MGNKVLVTRVGREARVHFVVAWGDGEVAGAGAGAGAGAWAGAGACVGRAWGCEALVKSAGC